MKKIFTLLFCLIGMTLAANATDRATVDQCIQALLNGGNGNTTMLTAPNLDANQDGVLNIHDVTFMIQEMLQAEEAEMTNRAPAKDKVDVDALIKQVLETKEETPNIHDVTNAVEENNKE